MFSDYADWHNSQPFLASRPAAEEQHIYQGELANNSREQSPFSRGSHDTQSVDGNDNDEDGDGESGQTPMRGRNKRRYPVAVVKGMWSKKDDAKLTK